MKIIANTIRVGNIINYKNKLFIVNKIQHTQPGKGGAYIQTELKDIHNNTKLHERFRSSEELEKAHLEDTLYTYLFQEQDECVFMHPETFEQIPLRKDIIGDSYKYLQEGMSVTITSYENDIISLTPPNTVIMEVVQADTVVKGQTASSSYKPATLKNQQKIMVPPHIEIGTNIVVNTADGSYVERAKEK